ncbi:acyltransferase family protein [Klugiella xanthotipulae]|uniref:Peptidoglycan/LPS O-acetylase OafA/YrhL n=1 Tax=Klugiella xanthotipulae TaxID=244735 RepID=A0A543I6P7_9MICO|nr:acyltransferase [Klugiella xanthotipulae]TQM66286.1 peptidoglycan/LPS O-acetylase OafA/YrhL [Klugiella xanthotipulae]
MTLVGPAPTPTQTATPRAAPPAGSHRDRSIDLARAFCLVVVVALHSMMVGVSIGPHGPLLENALENRDWFAPVSWVVQVMPLFFIVGGYSSITHWRRMRERGHSASDYVSARIHRLLTPTLAVIATAGTSLLVMSMSGVPAEIVATAGFRLSQPLWFLGVYVLCSAAVPLLVRLHESRPVATLGVLLGAIAAVDTIRFISGIEAIGFLNLLFVWLCVQQLGFWLADNRFEGLSRTARIQLGVNALLALLVLSIGGPYSLDMIENLNPPTLCLVLLGLAQLCAFTLVRDRLRLLAEHPRAKAIMDGINTRSMTIYLWHMPVLLVFAAILLLAQISLPAPVTGDWWATRPLWLAAVGLALIPVVRLTGRLENMRLAMPFLGTSTPVRVRTGIAVLLGAGGVLVLLVTGLSLVGIGIALVMMTSAVLLATLRLAAARAPARAATQIYADGRIHRH